MALAMINQTHKQGLGMARMCDAVAIDPSLLAYRMEVLDKALLESPEAIANATKVALIGQLQEQAPWMLPMII